MNVLNGDEWQKFQKEWIKRKKEEGKELTFVNQFLLDIFGWSGVCLKV